ncbi:heavy metal-binding domain-containing protein [Neolewinella agarilytica]|uniref:Heavy metal binding domain-containing protein n=1 Tax=Neolewinella agarilytica TaxID=478744 RepID=A0A1H9H6B9_9BACT|nr:heavy metal-binding domain-containing protein [Neolewinella agarilytica]SEQ57823.1 hypothetical protein SAMN05444359_11232 [Neolewinella agarilytica]
MRFFKSMTALVLVLSFTFAFTACGDSATTTDTATETTTVAPHGEGKEFTSAYVCPMHCDGSGSDKPGECPVCGMDYVAQAEHTDNGHKH